MSAPDPNTFWIGGQFVRGDADAALAVKLYGNKGMHDAARCFGFTHPRAVQYLEQAPAIALGAMIGGVDLNRRTALFVQHKLVPLCERGAALKEVMAAFNVPYQLRKLKASALFPTAGALMLPMKAISPAVLGRIVPEKSRLQQRWLRDMLTWRSQMAFRRQSADRLFAWAAERMAAGTEEKHDAATVADFACSGEHFNEAWQWPRAMEEADLWHGRLTVDRALKGSVIKPDTVIDMGTHPDASEHAGLDFVALRTPRDLAEEGSAMRHCVATYVNSVANGQCHIIGLRRGDKRIATLELRAGRVSQLKGRANSVPDASVQAAAASWAQALRERRPA